MKTALHRSGFSNPFGKLNFELPKVKLPDETGEILTQLAAQNGQSMNEFVRMVLMVRAHGVDAMLSVERQRLMSAAGTGEEDGEQGGDDGSL